MGRRCVSGAQYTTGVSFDDNLAFESGDDDERPRLFRGPRVRPPKWFSGHGLAVGGNIIHADVFLGVGVSDSGKEVSSKTFCRVTTERAVAFIPVHTMVLVFFMAVVRQPCLTSPAVAAASQVRPLAPMVMVMVMGRRWGVPASQVLW